MLKCLLLLLNVFALSGIAHATVTLMEKADWKIQMSGFIEMNNFHDSTRSLSEVAGNSAIAKPGTANGSGDNGRTQMSIRNSRLAFSVYPPIVDDVKSKGYFEFDLLGYQPNINSNAANGATNSESSFFSNATLRIRHVYLSTESHGWHFLVGQYWTLFGWVPIYVPTSASIPPGPGIVYHRTPQITAIKTLEMGPQKLQLGASIARPTQMDSSIPNIDIGARFSFPTVTSSFSSPQGDVAAQPMSVALSATSREYVYAKGSGTDIGKTNGFAYAIDTMIPILQNHEGDLGNSLTFTAEYASGSGHAESFPGWTGGLSQMPRGSGQAGNTNLDAGRGGFDGSSNFVLVKIDSWNTQLQYHLPQHWHSFITAGYAQLSSGNINQIVTPTAPTHDKLRMQFFNFFHDCTPQIRVAVEWARFETHYLDDTKASNDRYQFNAYFRF